MKYEKNFIMPKVELNLEDDELKELLLGDRDKATKEDRILLALYDETVAGLDQLPEVERTILTRQYIEGEYQPTIRDELGLKASAYYRR